MTLTNTEIDRLEPRGTASTRPRLLPGRDPRGLEVLHRSIDAAVRRASGHRKPDAQLSELITTAVQAFVDDGDPVIAARRVAYLCHAIGARQARLGRDADDLAGAFRTARISAQQGLAGALDQVCGDDLAALREQLGIYLRHLFGHALHGLTCTRRLMDLTPAQRLDLLRDQLFHDHHRMPLATLLPLCDLGGMVTVRPVVSRTDLLDRTLRQHSQTVAGRDPREVLVPGEWTPEDISRLAGGPVALGPVVDISRANEAVRIARAAARVSSIERDSDVSVDDVLGPLLVSTSPLLVDLLVQRHLSELSALTPVRRLGLAETLLHWLQSGQPINSVARELGLPAQTAHSRIAAARKMFGDLLDDADGRLELMIALRSVLPQWHDAA